MPADSATHIRLTCVLPPHGRPRRSGRHRHSGADRTAASVILRAWGSGVSTAVRRAGSLRPARRIQPRRAAVDVGTIRRVGGAGRLSAIAGRHRSAAGELLRRQRPQHVELVAVRIRHHYPTHVRTLADVDAPRAETFQPRHLGRLVLWPQIEVEAVLRLLLGRLEEQVRDDAVFGAAGWRLENDLTVALVSATPPERGLPETRQSRGIPGTD